MGLKINELKPLEFDWDRGNKNKNFKKHQVEDKEGEQIFFNRLLKTFIDLKHLDKEKRFIALGITDRKRELFVSFTVRSRKVRIISARNMSRKERRIYEQK